MFFLGFDENPFLSYLSGSSYPKWGINTALTAMPDNQLGAQLGGEELCLAQH